MSQHFSKVYGSEDLEPSIENGNFVWFESSRNLFD